ncbi:MAG: hypothetical protein C0408_00135 [Odoribacter sp.]|nr:hypothetical protein [Odoribacter sp.]
MVSFKISFIIFTFSCSAILIKVKSNLICRALYHLFPRVFLKRLCLLISFFLIFCSDPSFSQNFPFREYTVLDGLPQSQSSTVVQDSRGFIWIGTRNGLSRFDGIDFKNYFRKDGLPSNYVLNVIEDNDGIIWALSKEGLSKYSGNGFDYFPVPNGFEGWIFPSGYAIDNSNNIFIPGFGPDRLKRSLIVFNNGIYSNYSKKYPALDTLDVSALYYNRPTNELFLTDRRKSIWLWKNNILSSLSKRKFDFIYSENGNLLGRSNDTIFRYVNNTIETFGKQPAIGRPEVTYKSDLINSELEFFDGRFINKLLLPFNSLGYIIDDEGVLWFSSEKNLYRLLSTSFRGFSETEINARNIWAIAEDRNGHIWFGSLYGTLIEFDGTSFRERNDYKTLFKGDIGFFKGSRKMSNGDIWFSTYRGVLIWDGRSFSRLKGIPEDTQICYVYEDPIDKSVMLGTEKGLFHLTGGKILWYPEFIDNSLGVIEGVTREENGKFLLSGHKGLIRFDGINSAPVRESILPDGYTYTLEKDSLGGVWVTSEEGLYFRKKDSETFIHGLPVEINVSANSICQTDNSHIVVGRISDVCLIDLKKFYENDPDYFIIFDKTSGFSAADCLDNGIIKDKNGKIWILSSTGVVIFEPDKVRHNLIPPKLHIITFDFESDSLTWEPVEKSQFFYGEHDNIKIKRHNNTIRISFTGISTTNPEKVKYRHRLIGFEDNWSLPTFERSVEYENLSPGKYSFQVIAANANGIENTQPLTISFKVVPAFWQTAIFKITAIVLLIISTIIITVLITKRNQVKKAEKERLNAELSRLQMNSVIKQFDPHFTFNVISSVGSLIMKGEKDTAYDYILKLSALLRTVLNEGSVVIKSLSAELDFVKRYCELQKLRFKDRFNYSIVVKENIDLQRDIPKMTIQTFVENAIKHGIENRKEGGRIDVTVQNSKAGIEINVKDNGIGREAARRLKTGGSGYGLKIITGIFNAMNENNINKSEISINDIKDERSITTGTDVSIFIPDDYRFEPAKKS